MSGDERQTPRAGWLERLLVGSARVEKKRAAEESFGQMLDRLRAGRGPAAQLRADTHQLFVDVAAQAKALASFYPPAPPEDPTDE